MTEARSAPGRWRGRTRLLSAASGFALAACIAAGLSAHAQQVVVGAGQTSGQVVLDDGETLIVEQGGTVTNVGDAVIDAVRGSVTVINRGTIVSTGAEAIDAENSTLILFNTGTISGGVEGVFASTITSLVNTGTISGGEDGVNAGNITSLVNSGTIRGGDFGVIINVGTIVNTGSGLIEGATAIDMERNLDGNGSVTNAGRIRSTLGPSGTAIDFLQTGVDRLTVLGRSTIEGRINWDGADGDRFATGPGRSSALTFTDNTFSQDPGDPPTVFAIDTGGLPFAVVRTAATATEDATTKVVVIDPTSFGVSDTILGDITGGISGVLTNQADAARNVSANANMNANGGGTAVASANGTSMTITPAAGHGPVMRAWAEVFGGWRGEERDGNRLASDHVFGGAVAGIETDTAMDGTRAGAFVGGSGSKVDVEFGSQDTDIALIFGGFYAAHEAGSFAIDAAFTVGLSNYDQRRFMNDNTVVGGVDTARADYNGVFVSPEVTLSSWFEMTHWIEVKPSLTLRYAGLFLDGYSEKGSNANLTVEHRDVHVISARAQAAVPVHVSTDAHGTLNTEIRVGADGRATVSEDKVQATLLGQNLNFTAGGDDEVLTGFAGVAFAYAMMSGTQIYGNMEAGYGTDEAAHVTGRAGVKVPFGATSGQAQGFAGMDYSPNFYVSTFGGVAIPEDVTGTATTTAGASFSGNLESDTGFAFGGALGTWINESLRAELEVSYQEVDADKISLSGAATFASSAQGSGDALYILANVWFDVPLGMPVQPYLGGGLGVGIVDTDVKVAAPLIGTIGPNDTDTGFAFQAGAGFRYEVSENISLDLGYRFKGIENLDFDDRSALVAGNKNLDVYTHVIQGGLTFEFGAM